MGIKTMSTSTSSTSSFVSSMLITDALVHASQMLEAVLLPLEVGRDLDRLSLSVSEK